MALASLLLLLAGCPRSPDSLATPYLVTNTNWVTIPEDGVAGFLVKLSSRPASDVTVTISRLGGDPDITIPSDTVLTFGDLSLYWNRYQVVKLAAAPDNTLQVMGSS